MKNTRATSIIRPSILLVTALLWACGGADSPGEATSGVDSSTAGGDVTTTTPGDGTDGPDATGTDDVTDPALADIDPQGKEDADPEGTDDGETTAPDGETTAPDGETTAPDGETTAPDGETTTPDGETTDPEDAAGSDGGPTEDGGESPDEDTTTCEPACDDKACGDDGCGGSCGDCDDGETCGDDGQCACAPACDDKACGDDGCEGSCGECGDGETCGDDGQCVEDAPQPCEGADQDPCEELGATRCAEDGSALVQACKEIGGCLQWNDDEICLYDDVFPNACTGKADICLNGACVPDGDPTAGCAGSANPCEMAACDAATGECSITMVEPGTPCNDEDVCTKSDICFGSECIGTATDALGEAICPQDCLDASATLACGDYTSFVLNGDIGTSLIEEYSCDGAMDYTGYETAFLVEAPNLAFEMPLKLAVELADPSLKGEAYADIIVLETSPGYACWANTCVDVGYMDSNGVATVELAPFVDDDDDPTNDPSYIVLVDGRDGFNGAVRLASWCVPGYTDIELYCTDGQDDDFDGMVDCEDPSCWETNTCLFEHDCANGLDDDEDGALDCADNDCDEHPNCFVELNCSDGVDDEGDGFVDCDDSDCEFTPACGDVCADAIPIGCGDVLTAQDPMTGSNTFTSFPCSPTGLGIASPEYESTHHVYHLQADIFCSARVQVSPESDDFVVMDIYAMGPGCEDSHCIEIETGEVGCQDPQTPASVFGGDACVQVPENYASSAWITVIPDNAMMGTGFDLSYGLEVICDCQ